MSASRLERVRAYALTLPDVRVAPCWGEVGFFHHPPHARRALFMTLKDDTLSLPLPLATFEAWFGAPPARPRRGQRLVSSLRHGPFAPHPLYAWRGWVRAARLEEADVPVAALAVREAYDLATRRSLD